jgi:hypothetical protein
MDEFGAHSSERRLIRPDIADPSGYSAHAEPLLVRLDEAKRITCCPIATVTARVSGTKT